MAIFNFQFGEFEDVSPNWFDWFSLIVTLIVTAVSIYFAYHLGEKTYKRDRDDKEKENLKNIQSENDLLKYNLEELNENILIQIKFLEEYNDSKNFKLKINPALQTNFLNFLNLKSIYQGGKEVNLKNELISSLYSIEKITDSLADELNNYVKKYNIHEIKFKNYRKVFYKKFYEYSNLRNTGVTFVGGIKKWKYDSNDRFMHEYMNLRKVKIANSDGTANHELIDKNFLLPMIHISNKYIPEDYNAIEIHDLTNDSHSAYIDMENLTDFHFKAIKDYQNLLEDTVNEINEYLK